MEQQLQVVLTGVIALGVFAQWLSWKAKLPAILPLLLLGVLVGPVTGLLDPDALFGDLLFPMVSLAVAVILFEGSLTLSFQEVRGLSTVIRRLVTLGALVSWAVAAFAAYWFVDLDWQMAALFGALVVVTGPTVIVPLLRSVRPRAPVATILRWEGIVIDPIGALLAVLVYEFIISAAAAEGGPLLIVVGLLFKVIASGVALGAVGGFLLGVVLRRYWLPDYLINVVVLAAVLSVFTAANQLAHESGLLAVTVMGIWMGNMKHVPLEDVLDFKEDLTILFVTGLFILLAARIDAAVLGQVGMGALLVLLAIQFVAQPLKVWLSAPGAGLGWREKLLIAWIGPRGIVAAAISGLFSLRLQEAGVAGAELLVPLTFSVIVGTVVFAGATAGPVARWLGVAEPEDRGVLILGANALSRAIAGVLQEYGFRAVIADSDYSGIRAARMEGLETFYGNVVSVAADRRLDLVGIGRLLAMSRHPELNALAAVRYKPEFGAARVHVLRTCRENDDSDRNRLVPNIQGQTMFDEDLDIETLLGTLAGGARISATRLSETFGWEAYRERYLDSGGHLLFAIDPRGGLHVTGPAFSVRPAPDWTLIGIHGEAMERGAEDGAGTAAMA